jgi:hypothetical protein
MSKPKKWMFNAAAEIVHQVVIDMTSARTLMASERAVVEVIRKHYEAATSEDATIRELNKHYPRD